MATHSVVSFFYIANFFMYVFAAWYDWTYVEIGHRGYGGKFKFLTFWNLLLQMIYFGLCMVSVFTGAKDSVTSVDPKGRSGLQRARDVIHATLAFPVGMFVVCTFWALYAVDRELVYPKALDSLIPPWLNHVLFVQVVFWALFVVDRELIYPESRARFVPPFINHVCDVVRAQRHSAPWNESPDATAGLSLSLVHTTVLPILLAEKYLVYHHHPRRHNGIFILSGFALLYLAWILWIAYAKDLWVYPVLRMMQNEERAVFIFFLLMFFISIYLLGEALTKFFWRKEKAALTASRQKIK